MGRTAIPGPGWIPAFLRTLRRSRIVGDAIEASGRVPGTVYFQRRRNAIFAAAWDAALHGEDYVPADDAERAPGKKNNSGWRSGFPEKLAETSNVSLSAEHANVPLATVYATRRVKPAFAEQWRAALYEGYRNLEMEVLGFLRAPAPERKMDVANALRLLAAHKESIAKEGAQRANVSAAEVRASIERKVEALRRQVADRKAREAARAKGSQ